MSRNLYEILRGGFCTRWHSNPDVANTRETLAEHHGRVAQIILALHTAPTLALIDAALHHDTGEPGLGDVGGPAKWENPVLAEMLDDAESDNRRRIGVDISGLTDDETAWLKFADRLAAVAYVTHVAPHLLARADWIDDARRVFEMAGALGVSGRLVEQFEVFEQFQRHELPFHLTGAGEVVVGEEWDWCGPPQIERVKVKMVSGGRGLGEQRKVWFDRENGKTGMLLEKQFRKECVKVKK